MNYRGICQRRWPGRSRPGPYGRAIITDTDPSQHVRREPTWTARSSLPAATCQENPIQRSTELIVVGNEEDVVEEDHNEHGQGRDGNPNQDLYHTE